MDTKKLKDAVLTSQHCQRNFDLTKDMPQDDIDTILFATTNCPSKQNLAFHNVVAITDRDVIEQIHEASMDALGRRTNPQVLGQLLLVFTERDVTDNFMGENGEIKYETRGSNALEGKPFVRNAEIKNILLGNNVEENKASLATDANIALGIAAGYCNLTAAQLGYRTGCSSCFDRKKVSKILEGKGISDKPMLLMGIGIKDDNRNRREHHVTGKLIDTFVKVPVKVDFI